MTDDFMATARKRMDAARDVELPHIERGVSDLEFVTGEGQWPEEDRRQREAEGKPCLVFNAMPQLLRQVTGQIRTINPAIKVAPADSAASKDVAEVVEGLVRHIEYESNATSIYEAAAESAAACSIGNWRIGTRYCEGDTFDQEIMIERIFNPFAVFYDPQAQHATREDARYCFIVDEMAAEAFKAAYPDAKMDDFTSEHRPPEFIHWGNQETVVVAEYFWIEDKEYEVFQLATGQVVRGPLPKGIEFSRKRTVTEPVVKWAKISGSEVLEGPQVFPGRHIPVVAVTGEEFHLGEVRYRSSVIRFAKDAQVLYNVSRSAMAEITMGQPRAPYMVTAQQIAGLESIWNTANTANRAYLPYNVDEGAPPPMRIPPPVSSQGLMNESQIAAEDMKRTTGIYDASLGARSNETSGVAINARKQESQNATSVYADNMVKAVAHTGRIIVGMIPEIYDAKRAVRILGEDDQEKMVVINDLMIADGEIQPVNDMRVGKYDVRVGVGPAYSTRREAASEGMMEFLRVVPQAAAVTADLVAKSQDWPDADRIAERLRKALPPGMAEPDEDPSPEEQQAMMQAQQAAMQQQQVQQAAMQIDMRKAEAEATEAEADAAKAQAEAQLKQLELAQTSGQLDALINQRVQIAVQATRQGLL